MRARGPGARLLPLGGLGHVRVICIALPLNVLSRYLAGFEPEGRLRLAGLRARGLALAGVDELAEAGLRVADAHQLFELGVVLWFAYDLDMVYY